MPHADAASPTREQASKWKGSRGAAVKRNVGLSHRPRLAKLLARPPPKSGSRPSRASVPLPTSLLGLASPQGRQLWGSKPFMAQRARRRLGSTWQGPALLQQGSAMSWWMTDHCSWVQDSEAPFPKPAGSIPAFLREDATEHCSLRSIWRATWTYQVCNQTTHKSIWRIKKQNGK